jgi:hypothetical protein
MPEEVARKALVEYLDDNQERSLSRMRPPKPMSEEERQRWQIEFQAAVEALRAGAEEDDDPVDIEDEITAAVEEVRQERAMSQRAAGA